MPKSSIGTFRHPGRPTVYEPKTVLKKTRKYLDDCVHSYRRVLKSKGRRSVSYAEELVVKLPKLEGLSLALGVHKDTIQDWKKKHYEFSVLIDELLAKQADMLIDNGLTGLYSPVITKVLLTKHGYRDGHEFANPDGSNLFRPSESDRSMANKAIEEL